MKVTDVRFDRGGAHGRRIRLFGLAALCGLIAGAWPAMMDARAPSDTGDSWAGDIIVTQAPIRRDLEKAGPLAEGMLAHAYGEGARLALVRPGARPKILTSGFHSACDPHVSFDGKRLLFAGKRKATDHWNIFEMAVDGSDPRQITHDMGDCRGPIYQGTLFTLDSKEPWNQICFASNRDGELNEYGTYPAMDLYSCRLDGTELRRLTFNPSTDVDPWMLPDGRMVYSSWERSTLEHGRKGRVALFAMNIDGTDNLMFSGDEGQRIKRQPCVTPSGLVVFVEADALAWDGSGRLAYVTLRRNLHSHHVISGEADGLFYSPSPLPNGQILVSRRDHKTLKTQGVWRVDPLSGRMTPVFDDPKYHDIQAQAVVAQPVPDGRSTVVLESESTGRLYCLDLFVSDLPEDVWVKPGAELRLRVLEGIPGRVGESSAGERKDKLAGREAGEPGLTRKRFLGEIPVEPDGSFNVLVPANTPIQLQLVDLQGMALRSSHWVWVKNKENRGCIGCHEDGERTPPNRFAAALSHPSTPLTLPPDKRRAVDFRRDVMPIIAAKCATAACHGALAASIPLDASLAPRARDEYNRSYQTLMTGSDGEEPGKYVHPGRARTSPLIWHLFNRNTSQPWDPPGLAQRPPKAMPPGVSLTDSERRTFVEWIDLGATWDALSAPQAQPASAATAATHGGTR
jgi:hypothetical protein